MDGNWAWAQVKTTGEVVFHDQLPSLRQMQEAVGGYIEAVMSSDYTVYCNEEGKLNGLAPNPAITWWTGRFHDVFAGDVVVVGPPNNGGEDTPLKDWVIKDLISLQGQFWVKRDGE